MTDYSDHLVVIPSVRPFPLEYFEPLIGCDFLVVDDSDGSADRSNVNGLSDWLVADRDFIDKTMGADAAIIPQHNPSCKNFGLWWAWKKKYKVIILLDDDCDTRYTPDFLNKVPVGKQVEASGFTSQSGWNNTLVQLGRPDLWARGYPYELRGSYIQQEYTHPKTVVSVLNAGLWGGTPDINGVDKLNIDADSNFMYIHQQEAFPSWEIALDTKPFPEYAHVATGQQLPLSIMNVQLDTKLVPAFFQPPDFPYMGNLKIRRHDDVWSMITLKWMMDLKGDVVTSGAPMIHHRKAGNPLREILSEHITNLIQYWYEYAIGYIVYESELRSTMNYAQMAYLIGQGLHRMDASISRTMPGLYAGYISHYGSLLEKWAYMFLE